MDSANMATLDHVISRLELIQNQQSKLDLLADRLEAMATLLYTHDQKQCLAGNIESVVTAFGSLLSNTFTTFTHLDSLLDKKLLTITRYIDFLDKKLACIANNDDMLCKKLSNVADLDDSVDKKVSNVRNVDNSFDKKLSDIGNIDSCLDDKLSNVTGADNFLHKKLSDITCAENVLDKKLSDATSVDNVLDEKLSDATSADALGKKLSDVKSVDHVLDKKLSDVKDILDKNLAVLTTACQPNKVKELRDVTDTRHEILGLLGGIRTSAGSGPQVRTRDEDTEEEINQTSVYCDGEGECRDIEPVCTPGTLNENSETKEHLQKCSRFVDSECQTDRQHGIPAVRPEGWGQEQLEYVLNEICSIPDLVRGQTRAELAWMDNRINNQLTAMETSLRTDLQKIICEINQQNIHENLARKMEQCFQDVRSDIYTSKREIFSVTEKEAQIVRDRLEGPLAELGDYVFDFYLENFRTLVGSERVVHSLPWHVNEMKSSMLGMAWFPATGDVKVCLVFARHPREVGLLPRPAVRLKVKATVCDIHEKVLPDLEVGEKTWTAMERNIACNFDWGCQLGTLSGRDLVDKGYGGKEGYRSEALLVRFNVTVC